MMHVLNRFSVCCLYLLQWLIINVILSEISIHSFILKLFEVLFRLKLTKQKSLRIFFRINHFLASFAIERIHVTFSSLLLLLLLFVVAAVALVCFMSSFLIFCRRRP